MDPKLAEFLQVMQPRHKSAIWANSDALPPPTAQTLPGPPALPSKKQKHSAAHVQQHNNSLVSTEGLKALKRPKLAQPLRHPDAAVAGLSEQPGMHTHVHMCRLRRELLLAAALRSLPGCWYQHPISLLFAPATHLMLHIRQIHIANSDCVGMRLGPSCRAGIL